MRWHLIHKFYFPGPDNWDYNLPSRSMDWLPFPYLLFKYPRPERLILYALVDKMHCLAACVCSCEGKKKNERTSNLFQDWIHYLDFLSFSSFLSSESRNKVNSRSRFFWVDIELISILPLQGGRVSGHMTLDRTSWLGLSDQKSD